jgi:hypothetical protein
VAVGSYIGASRGRSGDAAAYPELEEADKVRRKLVEFGTKVYAGHLDIRDTAVIKSFIEIAAAHCGNFDILVNANKDRIDREYDASNKQAIKNEDLDAANAAFDKNIEKHKAIEATEKINAEQMEKIKKERDNLGDPMPIDDADSTSYNDAEWQYFISALTSKAERCSRNLNDEVRDTNPSDMATKISKRCDYEGLRKDLLMMSMPSQGNLDQGDHFTVDGVIVRVPEGREIKLTKNSRPCQNRPEAATKPKISCAQQMDNEARSAGYEKGMEERCEVQDDNVCQTWRTWKQFDQNMPVFDAKGILVYNSGVDNFDSSILGLAEVWPAKSNDCLPN